MIARRLTLTTVVSLCSLIGFLSFSAPAALAATPPMVEEELVLNVAGTSAKLQAQINPEESETTYRFEYDTREYKQGEGPHGVSIPLPDGSLGAGSTGVTVHVEPEGLLPGTTYHYRVVTTFGTKGETVDGPDQTFTTQPLSRFALPDNRVWELVSTPNKHGATIYPLNEDGLLQAADDGSAITYHTNAATELEPKGFGGLQVQVLSKRGSEGWTSRDIVTPNDTPTNVGVGYGEEYRFFSSDLSLAVVEPIAFGFTPLSEDAKERTPYIRNDSSCEAAPAACYDPLVTSADVRPGATFDGDLEVPHPGEAIFAGAAPDLSHVLIRDSQEGLTSTPGDEGGLYEWPPAADGQLQLVSILPDGKPASAQTESPEPGGQSSGRGEISDDGSRVFWSDRDTPRHLYLRDMAKGETLEIGAAPPTSLSANNFEVATNEGSRVFFIAETESEAMLEVCDVVEVAGKLACETTALAPEVQGGVVGTSENGSYVYFVSTAALAANAEQHKDNLYVDHNNGRTWEAPQLIATLPQEDSPDWAKPLEVLTARVSPNGEWIAFMSRKSLTGYDNRDAVSGVPDEEVYLYHAAAAAGEAGKLVCASCDPTGARPVGSQMGEGGDYYENGLLGGGEGWPSSTWLAANISGGARYAGGAETAGAQSLYLSRNLSNTGRLFFNSGDALVPQDVNGTWDVYEYEPPGIGSCAEASSTFSARSGGCVDLITSGESPQQSAFMDASENGDDVFFLTAGQLASQDTDTSFDVYDAHVCSNSVPCAVRPVSPPPCSNGDACKAAPSPQPAIFGAAASATFKGVGDVAAPSGPSVAPKSLTRAQRLARALRACQKKPKKKRGACKRQARKRYRAVVSRKAESSKRGAYR